MEEEEKEKEEKSPVKKIFISAILLIMGLVIQHLDPAKIFPDVEKIAQYHKYFYTAIYFIAYLVIGLGTIKEALYNLFHGDFFDEEFLMTVASIGAICIREYPEAVAVMLFYQLGEYFEDYAVDKSKDSITALMKICPETANLFSNGQITQIKTSEIKIDDILIVKPGERFPVDGVVIEGDSFIDNSALTGESVPVEISSGSEVFSGAINKNAVIKVRTLRIAEESAASRIIKLVSESSEKKTRTERFITKFSKIYTPTVCLLAVLTAVIPVLVIAKTTGEWQWQSWIYRALMFLVVSCPCSIVISVPLTYFGGIGAASRQGILVKGSSAIDGLAAIRTAVFDKTGTLTRGIFAVSDVCCHNPEKIGKEELLAIAAHAEKYSNHPAAVSIKKAHNDTCCNLAEVKDAQEISGQGIKVSLDGKTVLAGNERLMISQNVKDFEPCSAADSGTVVHIAVDGEYAGHIVITDEVKEDSVQAIKDLKNAGVKQIVMLTGDNKKSAEKVSAMLGITDTYADLLPQDKVTQVEKLIAENSRGKNTYSGVAFTGDGINDAPVLARADVGIAMGGLGSDAAIESADVVIMNDSISKIAKGIKISRRTKLIAMENIVFSLVIKVAIMVISALGVSNMWIAVFGDVGVLFLAILNSLRMLRTK